MNSLVWEIFFELLLGCRSILICEMAFGHG